MGLTGSDYVKQRGNKLRMGSIPNSVVVVVMLHTGQGQGLTLYAAQFSPTPQSTYKMPFLMPRREGFANSFIISILTTLYCIQALQIYSLWKMFGKRPPLNLMN